MKVNLAHDKIFFVVNIGLLRLKYS